ncbi:acyl-CoA thioesterase [Cryptosporangium minutisporangium]|uniref:Acyl-CoA thioesterase n=1 Tax=Cryptosporangium minutisporangium TaxID=113569 RepID=A0ABP6TD59_9ACTN
MTALTATDFTVRFEVRAYELDTQGHVTTAVYLQYADHVRWALLRAAGVDLEEVRRSGLGPVTLETTIRFRRELRLGDAVDVTCVFDWPGGRTGRVQQQLHRVGDGALVAELDSVGGVLDLGSRRLIADPDQRWRQFAKRPELLGLRPGGETP